MAGPANINWSAIRNSWATLTQIAAAVMTVVATIVTAPAVPIGTKGIRSFASFSVAILAGIALLVLNRFRKPEHARFWAALAALLLALTALDYFWYAHLMDTRTEVWHTLVIVCGTELRTEVAKAYGKIISQPLARQLLDDAAGDPQLVWTEQSIRSSKILLGISYLVLAPLIGGCIMAATQIAMCAVRGARRPSPGKHPKHRA